MSQRFRDRVARWALGRGVDDWLADEIAQRTMLRLWQSADRYDPTRGGLDTWVFVLARTSFFDVLRERQRAPEVRAEPGEVSVEDEADRILTAAIAAALVERLDPSHREVIELAFAQGLSQSEIAERLGLPLGTVKSRCFYALKALRLHAEEAGLTAG